MLYPGREQTDGRFDCTDDEFAVEAPAGAALFFNIYLLHRSLEISRGARVEGMLKREDDELPPRGLRLDLPPRGEPPKVVSDKSGSMQGALPPPPTKDVSNG